jgi:hypothetical protein
VPGEKPTRYGLSADVFGLKIVSRHLEGIGVHTIAEELSQATGEKVTWRQVNNLLKSPECKRIMSDLNDATMSTAKSLARQRGAKLINEAFDVLEYQLKKKKNLGAVSIILKVAGVDVPEETKASGTSIQVIMPGAEIPEKLAETIDVVGTEVIPNETNKQTGD